MFALLMVSCSKENEVIDASEDLTYQLEQSSDLKYKGIFATLNSEYRATIDIYIPSGKSYTKTLKPHATVHFSDGTAIKATAQFNYGANESIENLVFTGDNLSFSFSADANGANGQISNAIYKNVETSIKIANANRGTVEPVALMGTYTTPDSGDHPYLGTGVTQTFNILFEFSDTGATEDITTQIILNANDFGTDTGNEQMGCEGAGDSASSCPISGSSFNDLITWSGIHTFDFVNDCNGVNGTWEFDSITYGLISGTFISDNVCSTVLLDYDFDAYNGSGFSPMPTAGQLDSNIIIASGFSGSLAYGGTNTSGDYARGNSTGGVTSGGLYSFEVETGNNAFGIQPGGSDFTDGDVDIKILNSTGAALTTFDISYIIYVNNDKGRGNSLNFSYSTDNSTFTPVAALDYSSAAASDALGFVANPRMTNIAATVESGGYLYIRFTGDDETGSGSRDEFAIDDILVKGI